MAKQTKKSSIVPLVIIIGVLAMAVGGFAMLYSTSKTPNANTAAANGRTNAANTPRAQNTVAANAPPGAAIGINTLGQPTAKVTVEEFADLQCPTCATVHPVMKDVQSAFAGNNNVRFTFRHFPLSNIHDKAFDAAAATEAAGMQGGPKFWAMMDQLMTNQQAWANNPNYRELWKQYAEKIGLDVAKWQDDMAGMAARGRIDLDIQRARGIGVASTPSVYINGRMIPLSDMNVSTMRQMIEAEIANASSASNTSAPAANGATTAGNANAAR
jgi:protein-disulfide isomerase